MTRMFLAVLVALLCILPNSAFGADVAGVHFADQITVGSTPLALKSTARSEVFQGSVKFGTALFGMWVGPTATDTDLRAALLSGHPGSGS